MWTRKTAARSFWEYFILNESSARNIKLKTIQELLIMKVRLLLYQMTEGQPELEKCFKIYSK